MISVQPHTALASAPAPALVATPAGPNQVPLPSQRHGKTDEPDPVCTASDSQMDLFSFFSVLFSFIVFTAVRERRKEAKHMGAEGLQGEGEG